MAIEVRIHREFDDFKLDVQFQSESRRIGILGASGCGKSLTLKSIAGIERPETGKIESAGKVFFDSAKKIWMPPQERNVGYLFQNYALFPTMTVEKNIGIALRCGKKEKEKKVRDMIERFSLQGLEKKLPGQLSGGQQQRTALARIMIYEPDMILLDEPFSALDSYLKEQTQRECLELLQDYPGTVILVSHSRDEIYRFSEEVLVMDGGKAVIKKTVKELFEHPQKVAAAKLTGCKNIEEIVWKDGKHLYVPGWDMVIPAGMGNVGDTQAIGIRAHEFTTERTESDGELVFPVYKPEVKEDLFEYHVQFFTSERAKTPVVWKVSKKLWDVGEKGVPKWLHLKREHILFLERE
ncbi:ATP-binding cassette domain-containing protein [Coprococcus sp. AF27-8]|nr:ATP-binding cassette domain-containing protein [Coprococcus sp. AF27-8]